MAASFGVTPVLIIDLSEHGASIEHGVPLVVSSVETMHIPPRLEVTGVIHHSVVTRISEDDGRRFRSGIEFRQISENAAVIIESILIQEAMRVVRLWEANANGLNSSPAIAALQRQSAGRSPAAYVWMRLNNRGWERSVTRDPNQPLDGFAVPAGEDPGQIAMLCETYEAATEAGRQFIRSQAQLAIAEQLRIPAFI
jgi:hypothetical protein